MTRSYDDLRMMQYNISVSDRTSGSGNINTGFKSAGAPAGAHLEKRNSAIPCTNTGQSNTSASETGNSGNNNDSEFIRGDTVRGQLEDKTPEDSVLPDIGELEYTTNELVGDRADRTPNKEHGSQTTAVQQMERNDTIGPESMDDTRQVTEDTAEHHIHEPSPESSSSGDPEHRLTDDADIGSVAEDTTTYAIDVPLADSFHCKLCAPIPKWYTRHGDLSKHIRRYHARGLVFRCHGCNGVFATLKGCKRHQTTTVCGTIPVTIRSPSQPPPTQQPNTLPVQRCKLPRLMPTEQPLTALGTRNTSTINDQTDINSTNVDQACVNNDPTSDVNVPKSDISTQLLNPDDPRVHTLTQQPGVEMTNHPPRPIATDPELNISEAECPSHESATKGLLAPNDWQKKWTERFNNVTGSTELEQTLAELIEDAKSTHKRTETTRTRTRGEPPPRRDRQPHHRQRRQRRHRVYQYDAAAASRIQKLYRYSRTRAIREVTEAESAFCKIPANELYDHFTRVFQRRESTDQTMPTEVPPYTECNTDDRNPFAGGFTPEEVWTRLHRCSNTAPGPDGLRYVHWKQLDRGGFTLNAVFNAIYRLDHIPQAWGESTTILLHKKGQKSEISNWRPISLSSTIAKLYSSILANRLGRWAARNERISVAQKGFVPVDGCCEHNFALQAAITDARRSRRQCSIAWLDLTNAFGSVPHETIFTSLQWAGLDVDAINVIRRLYAINKTNIRSHDGLTPEIHIQAGVKQGCPLSPIIFNLTMEPIIRAIMHLGRGYNLYDSSIDVLAYADDLTLVSETPEGLQAMLDMAGRVATWAGLKFNPKKCATLHVDGKRREALPTQFHIQEGIPPPLSENEVYGHLGVPTGYHVAKSADEALKGISHNLRQINDSLLAPWQKLDAINTFILPRLSFHLKNGVVQKRPLNTLDRDIKRIGKKCLNLPQRASAEPLYLNYQRGGLNLLPMNVVADISQIVHGLGLLQSAHLGQLSLAFLKSVVQKRMRQLPEPQDLANYLCGSMEGAFANEPTDISNIWTRLRSATRRLCTKINVSWAINDNELSLQLNGFMLQRGTAEYTLRNSIREYYRQKLLAKPDQGKVYEVTSATNPPNHFLRNGDFTRFADWRFIHRARLDCVPLNGSQRFGTRNKKCRRCGYANETLPHVLCHCKPNFVSITKRHNAIQDRLVKAFKASATTTVRINQAVPGFDGSLRPDFVAVNETCKTVAIIDITMPFENRYAAFQAARQEKQNKYAPLAEHYEWQGYSVFLDAFIVGALGGWDPANEETDGV